jgi:hypothetical protein
MSGAFKAMATIDRRVWHVLTFLIVTILLINPLGLPLSISNEIQTAYGIVNNLKPGDIVLINFDIAAFGWDELKGQCLSVVPHVFQQPGVKVVFITDQDQGMMFIETVLASIGTQMPGKTGAPWYEVQGKKYMEDYVVIGYFPGKENAYAALAADFRGNSGTSDWYKNDMTQFLDGIGLKTAADIDLAISFDCESGATFLKRHFFMSFGTPIIAGEIGVNVPTYIVDYNAKLIAGLIKSTRGAAEYQYISGFKGAALISMDAYSAIHILLIVIILVGNIGYFGWEKKALKEAK